MIAPLFLIKALFFNFVTVYFDLWGLVALSFLTEFIASLTPLSSFALLSFPLIFSSPLILSSSSVKDASSGLSVKPFKPFAISANFGS